MSSKFVTAGYIIGSQVVGGEIVSSNYSPNETGTYFNLINGDFEIAGGKINYNSENNCVNLRGVIVSWEETNPPNIADIPHLQGYLGINGTTEIGENYIISPSIGGGYLNISSENGEKVVIDPNDLSEQGYIFQVYNGKEISVGISKDGKALFKGDISATSLTLGTGVSISSDKVSGLASVATSGSYSDLSGKPTIPTSAGDLGLDTSKIIFKGDITQTKKTDSNGIGYLETSVPSSSGDSIKYATYDADNYIVFGRQKGTNSSGNNYICIDKNGLLTARNAVIYGTIYATNGEFSGKISTATLNSETIKMSGSLNIYSSDDYSTRVGYIGYKTGLSSVAGGTYVTTEGICLANNAMDAYFIVTNAGVRMQAGSSSIYAAPEGVVVEAKALYMNNETVLHTGNYKNYPAVFA